MSPRLIADLIGKPYADRGRGPDAYDCEGLFLEVQRRRGYSGPTPEPGTAESRSRSWLHIADHGWRQLSKPLPGCAVFFPTELHVGTMYDTQRFLHTSSEQGESFIDLIDGPQWLAKRKLFYDWIPQ